ncbi:uncharacterized protein F4822DRAFT_403260 [Hypoxylon trugodes]|uniref:uncharacterized protein n=1 Tax=Hypoxylon trugodes TaxID=326681 RepID=UPI00218E8718|nr:uncharacterized protein F4822DRAFT_403260 [Hypoxylon trugodes]KAI1388587.1 hypothetical protein F4822DRAFT_403260 [Hypoxylon trugodes]
MVRILQQSTLRLLSNTTTNQLYRRYPLSRKAMSSAADSNPGGTENHEQSETSSQKTPLPLPEPSQAGGATQLPVGGEGVRLDHLGPLVVNEDGTMSRISNWDKMAEIERQNALRILGKRNKLRLEALKAKAQTQA